MSSTGQNSSGGGGGGGGSIYLVSDPRMERHRPVPPPAGQPQHRQLDPPCERPERLAHIMDRLRRLERSLIGLRGGGRETTSAAAAASVAAVPFVKSNCRPVSRETGEFSSLRYLYVAPMRWQMMERGVRAKSVYQELSADLIYLIILYVLFSFCWLVGLAQSPSCTLGNTTTSSEQPATWTMTHCTKCRCPP